jgi:hypothetical protein
MRCSRIGETISYLYATLEFPMRQILTLLLSVAALASVAPLRAQPVENVVNINEAAASNKSVALAKLELQRITDLVAAGALPRVRVQQAEANLADAEDEAILERTLYGNLPAPGASGEASKSGEVSKSEEVSQEMIAAAQRRVDRQQARVERAREIVSAGVAAQSYLLPIEQELTTRETGLNLARLRAQLMTDLAAARNIPKIADVPDPSIGDSELFAQGMEHYEGDGAFDESRELPPLEWAFESKFAHALPISAEGETEVHRALGFDHRGRVDVAVVPSQPEGIWLRQYLKLHKIPYYAFAHAVPGKATAAHVHIGPGSTRLSSWITPRATPRLAPRSHSAD